MEISRLKIPFIPNPGQMPFVQDRYIVRERHLIGGTGSGKTACGTWEALNWLIMNPGIVGIIAEPTYGMIRRNLIPLLERYLGIPIDKSPLVDKFNKGDYTLDIRIRNKVSKLWFISVENPETAEGQSVDFWYLDEARLVRDLPTAMLALDRRLRGSGGNHPIGCWVTTTPDAPRSPLWDRTENPEKKVGKLYRVSIFDNRANLPKEYIDSIVRAHPGALGERFIYGRFAEMATGAFAFDSTKHVVDYMDKPSMVAWAYGVDFGWTNPACILAIGFDGDGRAYVFDEYYKTMATVDELARTGLDMVKMFGPGVLKCDPSEPRTIDQLLRAGLSAEGDRVKREDGVRDIGSRLTLQGDGRYRLYIHRRCVNLIQEMMTYNPQIKENDHAIDALRYGLGSQPLGPLDGFVLF